MYRYANTSTRRGIWWMMHWTGICQKGIPDAAPPRRPDWQRPCVIACWGGKRLRPVLCLMATEACGGRIGGGDRGAVLALELVHTYSLIHDDLPGDGQRRPEAGAGDVSQGV